MQPGQMTGSLCYQDVTYILRPGVQRLGTELHAELRCRTMGEGVYAELWLRNESGANSGRIRQIRTLDMVFGPGPVHHHGLWGDSCGERSFLPRDYTVTEAVREEPLAGRSSAETGFPFFDLSGPASALCVAIGWTGQWVKELCPVPEGCRVQAGLAEGDFFLRPGEELRLPSVLVVRGTDGPDARRRMRRTLRAQMPPETTLPVAIQCFDRYVQGLGNTPVDPTWATEDGQRRMVEAAARLQHIDALWLDAAWFRDGFPRGVGNYSFAPGFPRGLRPVADAARGKGMDFLLWFEPERVHRGSELFDCTEWLLRHPVMYSTRVFHLGDEAALNWLTEKLTAMLRENGVTIYRQDCNVADLQTYWQDNDEPGRRGVTEIRYINGLYRLWDALRAACPGLRIDNCASGGRRIDLETVRRSVVLWRSDTGCWPETPGRRSATWNQNQVLALSEYLPYHACAAWDTDAYTVRAAGTQGLACNFDVYHPEFDFDRAAHTLAELKSMQPYWTGDFYPLTAPTPDEGVWAAYQLALPDRGAVMAFRRAECRAEQGVFCLQAVEDRSRYRVTMTDDAYQTIETEYTGAELAAGLRLHIPRARGSVLVRYDRI